MSNLISLEKLAELSASLTKNKNLAKEIPPYKFNGKFGKKIISHYPKPSLMGVINLSADSWYRESVCLNQESALKRAQLLNAQGADIIDIGAESTLPNAEVIKSTRQLQTLNPLVKKIAEKNLVSVETYCPEIAEGVLNSGAGIINLTNSKNNSSFYKTIAKFEAGVIICYIHNANDVRSVKNFKLEQNPENNIKTLKKYFANEVDLARSQGLTKIWLDPGLGFYYSNLTDSTTRIRYQMETFLRTFELRSFGFPICHALPHAFDLFREEVRTAESFFATLALLGKTDLLRSHEISKILPVKNLMTNL